MSFPMEYDNSVDYSSDNDIASKWSDTPYRFAASSTKFEQNCLLVVAQSASTTMLQKQKALDFLAGKCHDDANIQQMIESGVVEKVAKILNNHQDSHDVEQILLYRYLKLFAHLTVSDLHFATVMGMVDLSQLTALVKSPTVVSNAVWQCLWALNNIVLDISVFRRRVLDADILGSLLEVFKGPKNQNRKIMLEAVRLLSNLAVKRGMDAPEHIEKVIQLIFITSKVFAPSADVSADVQIYVCEFLAGVSFRDTTSATDQGPTFEYIMQTEGLVENMMEVARKASTVDLLLSLKVLSVFQNLSRGSAVHTARLIDCGIIECLEWALKRKTDVLFMQCATSTLASICGDNSAAIQAVMDANLVPVLLSLSSARKIKASTGIDPQVQRAADCALMYMFAGAANGQIQPLLDLGALRSMKVILGNTGTYEVGSAAEMLLDDTDLVCEALECVTAVLLNFTESDERLQYAVTHVISDASWEDIVHLQTSARDDVREKAIVAVTVFSDLRSKK